MHIPIRNKSKDNPYTLKYDETNKSYIVEFTDNKKINQKVSISEQVYEAFNKFELEDVSQIHKFQRHIEHIEMSDEELNNKSFDKAKSLDEEVESKIMKENLMLAINQLSEVQKRRIIMYYFEDKTLKEIANIEGCSSKNVFKSIEQAKEKLKKLLKF